VKATSQRTPRCATRHGPVTPPQRTRRSHQLLLRCPSIRRFVDLRFVGQFNPKPATPANEKPPRARPAAKPDEPTNATSPTESPNARGKTKDPNTTSPHHYLTRKSETVQGQVAAKCIVRRPKDQPASTGKPALKL